MKQIRSLREFRDALERRRFLEKELRINLENMGRFTFSEDQVLERNIENLIGATQIPLGIAGPLKLRSTNYQLQTTYIPLATTEGALVASISRGCKAITEALGTTVLVEDIGITRGPVFKTKNLEHCFKTKLWIEQNLKKIAKVCELTSSHLKLIKTDCAIVGKNIFVRFHYSTGDAMGMNMATLATQQAVKLIEQETGARCIALAGNFDTDKKPAWLNFIEGRGKKVWAEVSLPKIVVKEVLKTTAEKMVEVVNSKTHLGSIMSGSLGFNAHFANIIAAIFIATGQDPAHVVEGSLGVTTAEVSEDGGLYFSVYLPNLVVGVVGGGTHLPTQQEALAIMNVRNVLEYSRAVGAAVLAGELSLIASLAEGSLAKAHQKLGRLKK